jgi:zinc transport system ATP-binding protein
MPAQKDFPASVYEVVLSGCLNRLGFKPLYSKKDKSLAQYYLESLGILDLKKECYRELSGGQQQRVLLARAMCAAKKLILLDEPVSGLDPKATLEFYDVLRRVHQEHNMAIVMVSHDINSAVKEAKHVLHLDRNAYFYGTREQYEESSIYQTFHPQGNDKEEKL